MGMMDRRRALMGGKTPNRLYLFKDGDQCIGVTGGWQEKGFYKNATGVYATIESTCLNIGKNQNIAANYARTLSTVNKIDFSRYSKLVAEYESYVNPQSPFARNTWYYFPDILTNTTTQAGAFGNDYSTNRAYINATLNTNTKKLIAVAIHNLPRKNAYISVNVDAYGTTAGQARDSYFKIYNLYFEE